MIFKQNISCRPYGAWELKTTYQRNMLMSIMMVTTTILGLVLLAQLLGLHNKPLVPDVEIIEKIGIVKLWEWAPKLQDDFPPLAGSNHRPSQSEIKPMAIPVAVADTLIYDNEVLIDDPDEQEVSSIIDDNFSGKDTGSGSVEGLGSAVDYNLREGECYYCLDPDSFIPLEIYPELISEEQPVYPEIARKFGFEGSVWLQVLIDKKGKVVKAEIAKTSGVEMFDEAALKASWKNRFSPGIQSGRPVMVWVKYKVEFVLRE